MNFPGGTSGKKKKTKKTRLPTQETQETQVRSLGRAYPLEEGMGTHSIHAHRHACVLSHFSHVPFFVIPRTVAHLVPLSMEFSKHEYWSGLPLPGDLPDSEIEPTFLASLALAGGFFTTLPPGKP